MIDWDKIWEQVDKMGVVILPGGDKPDALVFQTLIEDQLRLRFEPAERSICNTCHGKGYVEEQQGKLF